MSTVSRMLSEFDDQSVSAQQALSRDLVLERLGQAAFGTLTLDFDGSVQSTKRHEGTAWASTKKRKAPAGQTHLTLNANPTVQNALLHFLRV